MKGLSMRVTGRERRGRSVAGGFLVASLLLFAGCSLTKPLPEPAAPPTVFETGLALMADGDFAGAELAFRRAASR